MFIRVNVWGKQGEACAEHLHKGSPIQIWGELRYSAWTDKETGAKRHKIDVTALNVQFLSSGKGKPAEAQEDDFSPPDDDGVPF